MLPAFSLALFITLPTTVYLLLNYYLLKLMLKPSPLITFTNLYSLITIPTFLIVMGAAFLTYLPLIGRFPQGYTVITGYLVIAAFIQAILFAISAPGHIRKSRQTILTATLAAHGIPLLLVIVTMTVVLLLFGATVSLDYLLTRR